MKPISIYIHWPFCLSLCPYCDFNSHLFDSIDHELWLLAYKKEIRYFAEKLKGRFVRSIFFGGGTPSLMKPKIVEVIIEEISSLAIISDYTEITLEANPTSYEAKKFQEFKLAGVNRVSIGVQSLNEDRLKFLGRKHSAKDAINAINSATKLFSRYSFDLIYANQDQNLEQWQDELKNAFALAGGHISLYQLTIEKGTPFYKSFHDGKLSLPSNDVAASMYEWTNDYLKANKYKRYEISNYAIDKHECIHNLCYWLYDEYIGIGAGAHSRLHDEVGIQSVMMSHKPEGWLKMVLEEGHGIQTKTYLSKKEIVEEMLMMGTRLADGILINKFCKITGSNLCDVLNLETIKQYVEKGLVVMSSEKLQLTDKGLILHNYLVSRMLI